MRLDHYGPTEVVTEFFKPIGASISSEDTSDGTLLKGSLVCNTASSVGFRFTSSNITTTGDSVKAQGFNVTLEGELVPSTYGFHENCTNSVTEQDFADLPGCWVLGQSTLLSLIFLRDPRMPFAELLLSRSLLSGERLRRS